MKSKPRLAIMIGQMAAKKRGEDAPDHDEQLTDIADGLIEAVKSGDSKAVAGYLRDAYDVCAGA